MEDEEISVIVGGRAGEGISSAGQIVGRLLARLGYHVFMYLDYPSRIKGGHNWAAVRGAAGPIGAFREHADVLLAINRETLDLHRDAVAGGGVVIYNADAGDFPGGIGVGVKAILAAEKAPDVMVNSAFIGAFSRASGISWEITASVLGSAIGKETGKNLAVARRAFDEAGPRVAIPVLERPALPVFTGNEAIGLGLVEGGARYYFAYPMSPVSNLMHFLAAHSDEARVRVIQPESEIAVLLMALGCAYAGSRAAVGTSGGGFCLMTEGLGLAGIAELPACIVLGQRAGPSTGLATYTAQADLHFALNAGQGEFPRLVVAPGDAEEAMSWSATGMDLAWKYQLPVLLIADKTLCEGLYSLDPGCLKRYPVLPPESPGAETPYLRYRLTGSGISPMRFPPVEGETVRVNSHVHDADGTTTEDSGITREMADKRNRKMALLAEEIEGMDPVTTGGKAGATTALVCWGSMKGICMEIGNRLGLRVVRPLVLWPFPARAFASAMEGVDRFIVAELNESGQLRRLLREAGYREQDVLLKYDGRPFTVEELEAGLRRVLS